MKLQDASERSGIKGSRGRIVYELTGSACEGFAVKFRFFQQVRTNRKEYTSDQRATSYETPDGRGFDFVNRSFFNGAPEREVKGKARRDEDGVSVKLEAGEGDEHDLPPAIFMTAHVARLIEAAQAGETVFATAIFDGSDDGDEIMETNAVIGRRQDAPAVAEGEDAAAARSVPGPWWPVSIAYFAADGERGGEKLPVYQVSFAMHSSGVSRDLVMRYDDYALRGTLQKIEFLEAAPCDRFRRRLILVHRRRRGAGADRPAR